MTSYKLHCFKESGNSYKVALALAFVGEPWKKVPVDFFHGQTRQPAWRSQTNEMGEVPILEVGDVTLAQSAVILLHLADRYEALHIEPRQRSEVMRWLFFDNHKFTANLATYRWQRTFANPGPHPAVLDFLRQRTVAALDIVESHLRASRFIVGDSLTIADLSLAGYVYYPAEELGFDLVTEYPNIARWMSDVAAIPGWRLPYDLLA